MPEIIIRFYHPAEQPTAGINRIVGYVKVNGLIPVINALDLDANPRNSKNGSVVKSIQESILDTPNIFPFKTKGVLLAATDYEKLERGRYRVFFDDLTVEGILDGGHNMLAIGIAILRNAKATWLAFGDDKDINVVVPTDRDLRAIKNWDDFKEVWRQCDRLVEWSQEVSRNWREGRISLDIPPKIAEVLNVLVPVELIVPEDPSNPIGLEDFKSDLLEICAARNNNVQLATSTKANKHGYFDSIKKLLQDTNPEVEKNVEWKSNNGGDIKPQDIITLCWIPLALLPEIKDKKIRDDNGKLVEAPSPVTQYNGKESAMTRFERLMSSKDVTEHNNSQGALKNKSVLSALKIAAELPALYDLIYTRFPDAYNHTGGKYGAIKAVSALNSGRKTMVTPFGKQEVRVANPQGFIAPLVYGLQVLMEVTYAEGNSQIVWRDGVNPVKWLEEHIDGIVKRYANIMVAYNYDPLKIGKAISVYNSVLDDYKLAFAGL